jgi:hypothetical protein
MLVFIFKNYLSNVIKIAARFAVLSVKPVILELPSVPARGISEEQNRRPNAEIGRIFNASIGLAGAAKARCKAWGFYLGFRFQ